MKQAARLLVFLSLVGAAAPAAAQQVFESVGERALGMGGAFVAVADDATAVHWNPAGLASGGPAGMTIGWHRFQSGNQDGPQVDGVGRGGTQFTSLGTWPLGISYGTFSTAGLAHAADGTIVAQRLRTRQYGVTILQSIVQGLVVGSTLKYLRGSVVADAFPGTAGDALKAAEDRKADAEGAFDLDLGVMADMEKVRVGLTWKNLRSPSFGEIAIPATTLKRQARLGVAVLPSDGLTLAMDVDLDTVDLRDGLRRMIAFGGEGRLGPRLAVRTGIRWSLEGAHRTVGSVGGSVMLRPRLWVDGHYAHGRSVEDREVGVALRAGF